MRWSARAEAELERHRLQTRVKPTKYEYQIGGTAIEEM